MREQAPARRQGPFFFARNAARFAREWVRASIGKVQGGVVLKDQEIVALFWRRDERAVAAAREKYGAYLLRVAMGILPRRQDGEECVNDTYLGAWNSIPPQRPAVLQTYLGKLTRRIAIDRCRRNTAEKWLSPQAKLSLTAKKWLLRRAETAGCISTAVNCRPAA